MRGRDRLPAAGVGVVLLLQDQALLAVAADAHEAVGLVRHALGVGAGHQLDDGARAHRQRHVLQVQRGVVVLLALVQAQRRLLLGREVGADAAGVEPGLAVDLVGQQLHHGLVVDAGLDLRLAAD